MDTSRLNVEQRCVLAQTGNLLARMCEYAWWWDTGGLVPYEIAHDLAGYHTWHLDQLHDVRLLHYPFDVHGCGCAGRAAAGSWTIHDWTNISLGVPDGLAAF